MYTVPTVSEELTVSSTVKDILSFEPSKVQFRAILAATAPALTAYLFMFFAVGNWYVIVAALLVVVNHILEPPSCANALHGSAPELAYTNPLGVALLVIAGVAIFSTTRGVCELFKLLTSTLVFILTV